MSHDPVQAELIAVLVAVTNGDPRVLTIESGYALPSGQLETGHRSLQAGLRAWVERQTHHPLGYVEQLYTFADQQRLHQFRSISISYLGLSREGPTTDPDTAWCSWYTYFPWEDRRRPSTLISRVILPRLAALERRRHRPALACRQPVRPGWTALERGAGAAALRAALRGRAGAGSDPRPAQPAGRPAAGGGDDA